MYDKNEAINEIKLEGKLIGDFEVYLLSHLLESNQSVKDVNLKNNPDMSTDAVKHLQALCSVNEAIDTLCGLPIRTFVPSRKKLELRSSGLGDPELFMLLTLLTETPQLEDLDLRLN